jgi:hypothetical protein
MENNEYIGIIPSHGDGFIITAETEVKLDAEKAAEKLFHVAKGRLLDVNNWHGIAGEQLAHFQLTDDSGIEVPGPARKGLFFRVDIPGPGSKEGDGFDWVEIEEMEQFSSVDKDGIALRVRPASNPATNGNETAHFYSRDSTSTFTVVRNGNIVSAVIYDINTKANKESGNVIDKIRNAVVGTAAILSFSKLQWKNLTNGLLAR